MTKERVEKVEKVKKEKKGNRSETEGVKKSKKEKKSTFNRENVAAALDEMLEEPETSLVKMERVAIKDSKGDVSVKPVGALVPFANPLADEKVAKKVLKSVKKDRKST